MSGTVDVDGLLGAGEAAVADFDTLLAACVALGYPYPGPPLRELYGAEYGLDLRALDADCRALTTAADTADDALLVQHNVSQSTSASWSGAGGAAAAEFLRRHDGSAQTVVTGLRQAAAGLVRLRAELSRAVEAKIAAVQDASDRMSGYRQVWVSAAHAVLGGGGGQDVASEIVDQQVKPFVGEVVCGQLIPALRQCSDTVAAAYDSALGVLDGAPVVFDVPGDFGAPSGSAGWAAAPAIGSSAASVAPSSWIAPQPVSPPTGVGPPEAAAPAPAMPAATETAATVPAAAEPPATEPAAPLGASTSSMPTDLGLGSAAGGLGRQLTDALGGLLGSAAGLAPDVAGLGDLADGLDDLDPSDDANDPDDHPDDGDGDINEGDDVDDDGDDDSAAEDTEPAALESEPVAADQSDQPALPTDAADQPKPDEIPAASTPAPVPIDPPAEPVAAEPLTTKTPCEIAADELPQVGE